MSRVPADGRSSNGAQEINQQSIHFRRTLLLNPMSRAAEQNLPNQVGRVDFQRLVGVGIKFDHRIPLAGDEQRRLIQLRAVEKPGQLPVAIDVAIPVEPAVKTSALELAGEEIEVRLAKPWRQLLRDHHAVEEFRAALERIAPSLIRRGIA